MSNNPVNKKLALFGGPKTIQSSFKRYNSIGAEEVAAAKQVLESGVLSQYLGVWGPDFYGGEKVQQLERDWERYFGVRHAITVNSATSGLMAAVGAIGVEPGDEVIVSPWTMSASATAILVWNAIPVFADIEDRTFNLDPVSVESNITPQTRAIMVTDIFGHPAELDAIMAIARAHKLKVIEDCAQAPGARYRGRYAGTIADIGVYSLNYHKHIHTGEGGVCVTDDPALAERMQLIRNHAESVVGDKGVADLSNMIGFNFRMTEIEAAIGVEQLKKLQRLTDARIRQAAQLNAGLSGLAGLGAPIVKSDCSHVYYVYPLVYDVASTGISREYVVKALRAEGVPASMGYQNLHLLPMYQKRIAYGRDGFPWSAPFYDGSVSYAKGICPVAEDLQDKRYIGMSMCLNDYTEQDIDQLIGAFHKVWGSLDRLKELA
jgi:dTDP-4-amino-4,6-dideoxygalactose transaminase